MKKLLLILILLCGCDHPRYDGTNFTSLYSSNYAELNEWILLNPNKTIISFATMNENSRFVLYTKPTIHNQQKFIIVHGNLDHQLSQYKCIDFAVISNDTFVFLIENTLETRN